MAANYDYILRVGIDADDVLKDIESAFSKYQKKVEGEAIELKFSCTKQGVEDLISQIQKLHPEIGTSIKLNFDQNEMKKSMALLKKYIDKSMSSINIGKDLSKSIRSNISINKTDFRNEINDKYKDKSITKNVTSDYISGLYSSIERIDFKKGDLGIDEIFKAARELENVYARMVRAQDMYPDIEVDGLKNIKDFKAEIDKFYVDAGKYIEKNKNTLMESVTASYNSQLADFQELIKKLGLETSDKQTKVGVDPDVDAEEFIRKIEGKLEGKTINIKVSPDIDESDFVKTLEDTLQNSDVKIKVSPDIDVDNFKSNIEKAVSDIEVDVNLNGKMNNISDSSSNTSPKILNRNPIILNGNSVTGTMYHGTKSNWDGSNFDFSKAKTAQMGIGMYLTPDIDNVVNFGKASIKQVELDLKKCFIITNDYVSDLSDLYSAMGQAVPEGANAKKAISDIRKFNRLSIENSTTFRNNMLKMGYQGMYVGDNLANIKIPVELVIYDENELKNIVSFTNKEFQKLKDSEPIEIKIESNDVEKEIDFIKEKSGDIKSELSAEQSITLNVEPVIEALNGISQEITKIREAFGSIDAESGIPNLLKQISDLKDAMVNIKPDIANIKPDAIANDDSAINKTLNQVAMEPIVPQITSDDKWKTQEEIKSIFSSLNEYYDFINMFSEISRLISNIEIKSNLDSYDSTVDKNKLSEIHNKLFPFIDSSVNGLNVLESIVSELQFRIKTVDEIVNRISKNSSIKDINVSSYASEIENVVNKLKLLEEDGKVNTEEFITLQLKIKKMLEDNIACYGGLNNMGVSSSSSARSLIISNWKQDNPNFDDDYLIDLLFGGGNSVYNWETAKNRKSPTIKEMVSDILPYKGMFLSENVGYDDDVSILKNLSNAIEYIKSNIQVIESARKNILSIDVPNVDSGIQSPGVKSNNVLNDVDNKSAAFEKEKQVVNGVIDSEVASLRGLSQNLISVANDVDGKTAAFEREGQVVSGVIQGEINDITALDGWIDTLTKDVNALSDAFKTPIDSSFINIDDTLSGKIGDIADKLKSLKEVDLSKFSESINDLAVNNKVVKKIENLGTALGTLVEKFGSFGEESKANLASINSLLQNAEALRDLSKVLSSSDSKRKNTKKKLDGTSDDEVKVNEKYVNSYIANLRKLQSAEKNFKSTEKESYKLDVKNLGKTLEDQYDNIKKAFDSGDIGEDLFNKASDYRDAINNEINQLKNDVKTASELVDGYIDALKKMETAKKRFLSSDNQRYDLDANKYKEEANKLWGQISGGDFRSNNADQFSRADEYRVAHESYIDSLNKKEASLVDKNAFSDAISGYSELINSAQRFYNIQFKIATGKELSIGESKDLEILSKQYIDAANAAGIFAEAQTKNLNQDDLKKFKKDYEERVDALSKILQNKVSNVYKDQIDLFNAEKGNRPDAYSNVLDNLSSKIREMESMLPLDFTNSNTIDSFKKINSEIKTTIDELKTSKKLQYANDNEKTKLTNRILNWRSSNSAAERDYGSSLSSMVDNLKLKITKEELAGISDEFDKIIMKATEAGKVGASFGQKLTSKFKDLAAYLLSFVGFYDVINILKQGVEVVHELDDALTEMRKVSDESLATLKEYQKESFDTAKEIGTTAKELQDSTATWLRLGESFNEAKQSAQDTTILKNVSEFESIDAATESLVAMSQAYDELSKKSIIDKLNNVGNNFSISTSDLAEALQKSAAVLKTQSNSIDEAIALITAGGIYIAREYGNIFHRTYLIARTP